MSEMESAPAQSTGDIAASVIESHEPSESTPVESAAPETTPAITAPPTEELSPSAKFLIEKGHKWGKRPDGKTDLSWLPASTVAKMMDSYVETHKSTWDGEKQTLSEQIKDAQELRAAIDEQRAMISGDPRQYIAQLATVFPQYQSLLQPQAPPAPAAPMPDPDITLSDGSRTYSIEGLQKLLAWNSQQVESKIDERLKPLTEREEQAKAQGQLRERTQSIIAEAQTWPGFKEHEADMLKALQEDSDKARAAGRRPTLSLEAAYRQVVVQKLAADRQKIREELLAEQNASAAVTPTVARAGAESPKTPKGADTREIASRIIAQMDK